MNNVFAPTLSIHSLTLLAVKSGPLSDLMYLGTPSFLHQLCKRSKHIIRGQPGGHLDRQALSTPLIDHRQ